MIRPQNSEEYRMRELPQNEEEFYSELRDNVFRELILHDEEENEVDDDAFNELQSIEYAHSGTEQDPAMLQQVREQLRSMRPIWRVDLHNKANYIAQRYRREENGDSDDSVRILFQRDILTLLTYVEHYEPLGVFLEVDSHASTSKLTATVPGINATLVFHTWDAHVAGKDKDIVLQILEAEQERAVTEHMVNLLYRNPTP